jgi:hypothetical protein
MAGPRPCWQPTESPQSSCRSLQARTPAPAWTTSAPRDSRRGPRAAPTPCEARERAVSFRTAGRHSAAGELKEQHLAWGIPPESQPGGRPTPRHRRPTLRHRTGQHSGGRPQTRRSRFAICAAHFPRLAACPHCPVLEQRRTSPATIARLTMAFTFGSLPVEVPGQTGLSSAWRGPMSQELGVSCGHSRCRSLGIRPRRPGRAPRRDHLRAPERHPDIPGYAC